jgi:proteasome beta subunit
MYGFSGTVVGVVCRNGVALASDSRGVGYYLILSKRVKKIFQLEDMAGAAISGSTGDVQSFVNLLRAEARLYRLHNDRPMSTKSLAQMASNILHDRRIFPYILEAIIAGIDKELPVLYFLDPVGGKLEEREFAAGGTGASVAYGALEKDFRKDLTADEGAGLAALAIKTAIERDAATGDAVAVAVIDERGYRELSEREIAGLLKQ